MRFNGFRPNQFFFSIAHYVVAGLIATYISPWLGVFVAMIHVEVR